MNFKDKINNYIKSIANQVFDERQPKEESLGSYSLPEIHRNELLAHSIQKTHKDIIPALPAGVAMDAAYDTTKLNNAYNITNPVNDIIYTHFAVQGFIGFQACAVLCQNWLINRLAHSLLKMPAQKYETKEPLKSCENVSTVESFADFIKEELKRRDRETGKLATAVIDSNGGRFTADDDFQRGNCKFTRSLSEQCAACL